jgi:hypothetical protein
MELLDLVVKTCFSIILRKLMRIGPWLKHNSCGLPLLFFGGVFGLEELDLRKFAFFFLSGASGAGGSLSIMDNFLDQNKYLHASNMRPFCCGEKPWINQHPRWYHGKNPNILLISSNH